jgi:hypothetical protein
MMQPVRFRVPIPLLVVAIAASAILAVYLWVRALGSVAPVTPHGLTIPAVERRPVAVLPVAVLRPVSHERAAHHKKKQKAKR